MNSKGFSLLETIIAFMILSVFMMVIINTVVQNSARGHKVTDIYEIMSIAENAMSEVKIKLSSRMIQDIYQGKTAAGYSWQARVEKDEKKGEAAMESVRERNLFRINLYVHDSARTERMHLETVFFTGDSL